MSFVCDYCGFRTNEVIIHHISHMQIKGGGSIPKQGQRTILRTDMEHITEDLRRDVLKSDTAAVYVDSLSINDVQIPEVQLELEAGTLGGMYTTVEGLLDQIIDNMSENNPVFMGDSAIDVKKQQYAEFMEQLKEMKAGKRAFTIDIVDPLANSWVYSEYAPNPDPRLEIVDYTRSYEEDEALGLNDMVVDDDEITRRNEEEKRKKLEEVAEEIAEENKA